MARYFSSSSTKSVCTVSATVSVWSLGMLTAVVTVREKRGCNWHGILRKGKISEFPSKYSTHSVLFPFFSTRR